MIHYIVHYVSQHPNLAYGTLFLAALLEAVPVVGSFVPGSTLILSLSALIATGDLGLGAVLVSTMAGALIGDGAAFWLGHSNQGKLARIWPLYRYPEVVGQSEAVFKRYGRAAVLIGRFLPPVRAFVPVVAGALAMPPRKFYPLDAIAIALWAPLHVFPGYLAGTAYRRAGALAEQLVLPVVASIIAIAVLVWAYRRWAR